MEPVFIIVPGSAAIIIQDLLPGVSICTILPGMAGQSVLVTVQAGLMLDMVTIAPGITGMVAGGDLQYIAQLIALPATVTMVIMDTETIP